MQEFCPVIMPSMPSVPSLPSMPAPQQPAHIPQDTLTPGQEEEEKRAKIPQVPRRVSPEPVRDCAWLPLGRRRWGQSLRVLTADRSTGFEKKWIQAQNTAARETYEFNKWSAEDM